MASLRDPERYCLRLLLLHTTGVCSLNELKKVPVDKDMNEIEHTEKYTTYKTYKQACIAYGLLSDDKEWQKPLTDAAISAMPYQLRDFFCLILSQNSPTDPNKLYVKFKDELSDDYLYKANKSNKSKEWAYNKALIDIQRILNSYSFHMEDFGLPVPQNADINELPADLQSEIDYNWQQCESKSKNMMNLLNNDQKKVFKEIKHIIDNKLLPKHVYFVDAPGGHGKSYLFNALLNYIRGRKPINNKKYIALAVSATGISALELENGRTAHFRFNIPLQLSNVLKTTIEYQSHMANIIRCCDIIIWDEASMIHKYAVNMVDYTFQDIMDDKTKLFGGKLVVFGGDFRQTLPIIKHGSELDQINSSIKYSNIWKYVKIFHLRINERIRRTLTDNNVQKLNKWHKFLLSVGNGTATASKDIKKQLGNNTIELPQDICFKNDNLTEFVNTIYYQNNDDNNGINMDNIKDIALLTPKNKDVSVLNELMLNKIKGNSYILKSIDCVGDNDNQNNFPLEFLNSIKDIGGIPNHKIELKKNIPVMVLRNLSPKNGVCNGTRCSVDRITPCMLETTIFFVYYT